jgi:hypothetical protein
VARGTFEDMKLAALAIALSACIPVTSVNGTSQVRMVGKPTVDRQEVCQGSMEPTCAGASMLSSSGISGAEEAQVIHGVLAELRLDGAEVSSQTAEAGARAPSELGHLTLHGCGRP